MQRACAAARRRRRGAAMRKLAAGNAVRASGVGRQFSGPIRIPHILTGQKLKGPVSWSPIDTVPFLHSTRW